MTRRINIIASCAMAAVLATIPLTTFGQSVDSAGGPLRLSDAIAQGRQNHPSIEAARAGLRASDSLVKVAGLRPNPTLDAEVENFSGSGPYSGTDAAETTVGVNIPLELGGKRPARLAVANADRDISRLSVARTDADLVEQITIAYTNVVSADQRLLVEREHVALAQQGADAARKRVEAGKASPIESQRADVELMNAQVAVEKAQRAAVTARGELSRLTGIETIASVDGIWFADVSAVPPAEKGPSLSVATSEAELAGASARLRQARSLRTPDLNFGVGSRRFSETGDTALMFRLSVPIPLFDSGTANVNVARAHVDQAEANRRAARLMATSEVAKAEAELADAAAAAKALNGPVLAAAMETARIARIGYAEGKFSQLDLIDAERTLAQTRDEAIGALTTYHLAQARLTRLQAPITLSAGE